MDVNTIKVVSVIAAAAILCVAAFVAAWADSRVAVKALEGIARQPEAKGPLQFSMLIAIGMIEAIPIIAAVIGIVLIFANPLLD